MTSVSSNTPRDRPLPADWSVDRALQAYLDENGFELAAYDEPRAKIALFGRKFTIPNPPKRQRAIKLHDLHHVATGFGTDLAGEGQISAWEFRRGLRGLGFYVGTIVFSGVLLGLVVAPRMTVRAYRASRGGRSLFRLESHGYEDLRTLTVRELRELLDVAEDGMLRGRRGLHGAAPQR